MIAELLKTTTLVIGGLNRTRLPIQMGLIHGALIHAIVIFCVLHQSYKMFFQTNMIVFFLN